MIKKIQIHLVMYFSLHVYDDTLLMMALFLHVLIKHHELYEEVGYVLMLEQMAIFCEYRKS